jgi:hypothetical protein
MVDATTSESATFPRSTFGETSYTFAGEVRLSEIVVLDAVSVATIARAARDVEPQMLPDAVAAEVRRLRDAGTDGMTPHLLAYADDLDDIAEAAVALDQHDHEIEHQLRWWGERAGALEGRLTGHPADDVETIRELALYRGRISGAHTMRRHYAQQRSALLERHRIADLRCATALAAL